ncbi:Lanthionine synthetase C-like protein [Promicromonospora umidemergens]|uniref:Lanthionine synthetase C family protein n=1 Tax=Promicromonospora umidemergens TaxID=629679 RepID=A0ABP8WQW8_9MICO|nr:lanthionine synthetase C family protein [Promicromonospora umidemergens]MCP2283423.1 Lanthionine synthetase C-like protein [Promicromonospora umidemergens]
MTVPDVTNGAAEQAARLIEGLALPVRVDVGSDHGPASPRWQDQSLSQGAAGVTLAHGVLARANDRSEDIAHDWLRQAVREELTAGPGAGLWFGVSAVAFAIRFICGADETAVALDAAAADVTDRKVESAHRRMDARQRPVQFEFDITRGLAGMGAYLLTAPQNQDLLERVLGCLVRLTEPVAVDDAGGRDVPGWWVTDQLRRGDRAQFVHGHAGLGMAHGITGVLALLATCARRGIRVDGQAAAIVRIRDWIEAWRQPGTAGTWWPERITLPEHDTGVLVQTAARRPSWCYGTPGIARALQLAAIALGDEGRQRDAETTLARCITDPAQLDLVTDASLCHGWAGIVATVRRAAADAITPDLAPTFGHLTSRLVLHAAHLDPRSTPGLINGTAGVGLVLHEATTTEQPDWATCLLID